MSLNNTNGAPKRKLAYKFTCFVSRGDLDDEVQQDAELQTVDGSDPVNEKCARSKPSEEQERQQKAEAEAQEAKLKEEAEAKRLADEAEKERLRLEEAKAEAERKRKEEERLVLEGYKPRDGTDLMIYSTQVGVPPKSFVTTDSQYIPTCPPPTYLTHQELMNCTRIKKAEFLKGFAIPAEGGLLCTDQAILERQSGVIGNVIKQLITTLSISRISLPVRIFEPRSTLERILDLWRFAPFYLQNAAKAKDKIERFKQVIAFAVSGLYCTLQQLKPFNPIIGETIEASLPDGTKIYAEHTSHHPPISHFYIEGPDRGYKMYGHHEYTGGFVKNTLEGRQEGPNIVEFPNGQKIIFRYPKIKIHGMLIGDRMIYPSGPMTFEDPDNRIRAIVIFNHGKARGMFGSRKKGTKIDDFEGLIYYARPGVPAETSDVAEVKELKDVETAIGPISGSWLRSLKMAGTTYWDINKIEPIPLTFAENPLPSDWRFREDLIWLRRGNMEIAQEWKVRLEVEQRRDRSLREKMAKQQHTLGLSYYQY